MKLTKKHFLAFSVALGLMMVPVFVQAAAAAPGGTGGWQINRNMASTGLKIRVLLKLFSLSCSGCF